MTKNRLKGNFSPKEVKMPNILYYGLYHYTRTLRDYNIYQIGFYYNIPRNRGVLIIKKNGKIVIKNFLTTLRPEEMKKVSKRLTWLTIDILISINESLGQGK